MPQSGQVRKKNEGTKPADAAETTITTVKAGSPIAAVAARDGGRASVTASKCLVMASNQLRASVVLDGHRRRRKCAADGAAVAADASQSQSRLMDQAIDL